MTQGLVLFPGNVDNDTFYRLTGKEKRIGGFDLIWDEGPVMADDGLDCTKSTAAFPTNSFLGQYIHVCTNDHVQCSKTES